MKHFSLIIIALIFLSCTDDNNISTTPSISYEKLEFKKSENSFNQDSLILTINFIDGDGDLGLSNDENNYPYHPYNAIIDQDFNWVTLGSTNVTPPLYIYEPNGVYYLYNNEDNRPSFNCENYIIDTVNSTSKLDTFYIQKNENNKNIFIEFYKKEDNEFKLIDWKRIFDEEYGCGIDFNYRFPPLNNSNSSNPRSSHSSSDLRKTKKQLFRLTKKQLQRLAHKKGVNPDGKKEELINRIKD